MRRALAQPDEFCVLRSAFPSEGQGDGGIIPPSVPQQVRSGPGHTEHRTLQHPWRRSEITERHGSCGAQAGTNEPEPRGDGSFLVCLYFAANSSTQPPLLWESSSLGGRPGWAALLTGSSPPLGPRTPLIPRIRAWQVEEKGVGLARSKVHHPILHQCVRPMTQPTIVPSPTFSPTRFGAQCPTSSGFKNTQDCHCKQPGMPCRLEFWFLGCECRRQGLSHGLLQTAKAASGLE